jgi:hypothetical protein
MRAMRGRIAWLEAHGFIHRRSSFDLQRGIDPPLAPAVWPSAMAIARYRPGEDDVAVHALIYVDAAWGEVPGHARRSLAAWRSTLTPDHRGGVQAENPSAIGLCRDIGFEVAREWRVHAFPPA